MTEYSEMQGNMTPFSADGLTVAEIESFYREAKDKNQAVWILADCCATDETGMIKFLTERGLLSGVKKPPKKNNQRSEAAKEKAERVLALAEQGYSARECAEILEIPYKTIRTIAERNGICFFSKKNVKKGGRTMEQEKVSKEIMPDYKLMYGELEALHKESEQALGDLQAEYNGICEKLKELKEENDWLRQKLSAEEDARSRLESQLEIVYLICGKGR